MIPPCGVSAVRYTNTPSRVSIGALSTSASHIAEPTVSDNVSQEHESTVHDQSYRKTFRCRIQQFSHASSTTAAPLLWHHGANGPDNSHRNLNEILAPEGVQALFLQPFVQHHQLQSKFPTTLFLQFSWEWLPP